MATNLNSRERVLKLLREEEIDYIPVFSGMGNVTTAGLDQYGHKFAKVHGNAKLMAESAASSYKMFGFECAVVPFDLCVEAEAIGSVMNPYEEVDQLLYPTIKEKAIPNEEEMTTFPISENIISKGRIPVILKAIKILQADVGSEVAVGSYVLGPFTLAGQLMDLNALLKLSFQKQDKVNIMLDRLADVIVEIAKAYHSAGADYITVREMGATTDVISPRIIRAVVYPHLKKVFDTLRSINCPAILHMCGGTNTIMTILKESGPLAISVEQKNDLAKSRESIGWDILLFGNVDAYNILVNGTTKDVEAAVVNSIQGGVDAVWPSCDIWPTAPLGNLKAMVEAVKKYGVNKMIRKRLS